MGNAGIVICAGLEIALALFMFFCSYACFAKNNLNRTLVGGSLALAMGLVMLSAAILGLSIVTF